MRKSVVCLFGALLLAACAGPQKIEVLGPGAEVVSSLAYPAARQGSCLAETTAYRETLGAFHHLVSHVHGPMHHRILADIRHAEQLCAEGRSGQSIAAVRASRIRWGFQVGG